MKLTCPKCHAKSAISDDRVPPAGAWARCPKCQERFFIKPPALVETAPAPEAAPSPTRDRSAAEQKLLARIKAKKGLEAQTSLDGPFDATGLVVFPDPEVFYTPYFIVLGFIVAGLLGFFIQAFNSAPIPAPLPPPPPRPSVTEYGEEAFRADLTTLRRQLANKVRTNRRIEFSGPESRVFKFALARLAPNECQEIIRIRLWSGQLLEGFQAEADCLERGRRTPRLTVRWATDPVQVSLAGQRQRLTVSLSRAAADTSVSTEQAPGEPRRESADEPEVEGKYW